MSPTVTASRLVAAFASVTAPRRAASVRYPLAALLALTVTALLATQRSVLAIAEWAARQGAAVLALLRDSALSLLRLSGYRTIASRLRALADDPVAALALVTSPLAPHA